MARSHCTEPGTGQMGYYVLFCTVHTVMGMGMVLGPGKGTGKRYLICVPVMRCNHFQLLYLYIMPFSSVICS